MKKPPDGRAHGKQNTTLKRARPTKVARRECYERITELVKLLVAERLMMLSEDEIEEVGSQVMDRSLFALSKAFEILDTYDIRFHGECK
jgi:hypothetical protein